MLVESLVLDGQHGLHQLGRDLRKRNLDPPLLEDRERGPVLRVVAASSPAA